jgi:hypothetical protein
MTGRIVLSLVLLILAILCFLVLAFNDTPAGWTVNMVGLGLAFFAGSVLPRVWP